MDLILNLPPPPHLGFRVGFFTSGSYCNQVSFREFSEPSDIFQA